ncbi:MAG: hypothetical protein ACT6FD_06735 [Methanosarcinaceae archaeon]
MHGDINCALVKWVKKGYERLERSAVKVARLVLRRGRASNRFSLFGKVVSPVLRGLEVENAHLLLGDRSHIKNI